VENALRDLRGKPEEMYGRRKMTRYLRRQGHDVAFCTVDRLMRELGLNGVVRGRKQRTTIPAKDGVRAADRLNRDFTATAPNLVWVADFTYVSTWTGWAYVAFVFDVYSRAIVGWTAANSKTTALVSKALNMAVWRRDHHGHPIGPGLIHHSDAGSQYTSVRFTESLALQGLSASVGSVGDAYDNALAESIIGLFKTEVVNRRAPFKTLADVEYALMEWVDWYNNARLHSRLDYLSPAEYEAAYYSQQPPRRPALV
jgi:putative transposase